MKAKTYSALAFGISAMAGGVFLSVFGDDTAAATLFGLATAAATYLFGLHDESDING